MSALASGHLPRRFFPSRSGYRSRNRQRGFLNMHIAAIAARRRGSAIDPFAANLWGCYGLSLLLSAYTGSAIRVRRSSDNTEQNIGFTGAALDTAALLAFVGAGNGYVVKWYDQSGAGNDAAQATTTKQPQIVISGIYTGELLFDGVDDILVTANSSGTPSAFTTLYAGRCRAGMQGGASPSNEVIIGHASGTLFWTSRNPSYSSLTETYATQGAGTERYANAGTTDGSSYCARFDRAQATLATEVSFFVDGVAQTAVGVGGNSSTTTGNFTSGIWAFGGDNATAFARCALRAILIYEAAKSDADIASFSATLTPTVNTNCFDGFTTGLWGLYSIRKELSAYAGSSLRVRRSSDNTERDIGFSGGLLDNAALLAFAAGGSAYVVTWYDQSGAGHDFTQATTTKQPRLVNAGVLDAAGMVFDGSNDCLVSNTNGSATNKFTLFVKGATRTLTDQIILEMGAAFNTNRGVILYATSGGAVNVGTGTNATDYSLITSNAPPVNQILCATVDRTQGTGVAQNTLYSGGLVQSKSNAAGGAPLPTGNVTAAPWNLGARNNGAASPFNGTLHTVAIYESLTSAADIESMSRLLG